MYKVLTAEQMRQAENRAVEAGISLADLMAAAGGALATELAARIPEGAIAIACGPGNNGGDGWVAARLLHEAGRDVRVFSLRDPEALHGIAYDAARAAIDAGVAFEVPEAPPSAQALGEYAVVVDALLGTGAALPLKEPLPDWCEAISASGAYVFAVDLPTGVDSDTGQRAKAAVVAECTVTFAAPKRGLMLFPGAANAGEVVVADIGIPRDALDVADAPEVWTASEYATLLRLPDPAAHKNERGRVLVVAGSTRYPGAAVLAARGAMRSGAGYVTLAVPEPVVAIAQAHLLAAPVVGLPSEGGALSLQAVAAVRDLVQSYDAVVLGPGLTLADGAAAAARQLVAELQQPLVIDADGLNAFAGHLDELSCREAPAVLTPHPGELGGLLGVSAADVQADRVSSAAKLAATRRAVVLKGAATITSVSGKQVVNTSGTPALATAGTGDVLSGVIGALLAQGRTPLEAGALGAYVHGRAGEIAASELTPLGVTAEDLPEYLPLAMGELLGTW